MLSVLIVEDHKPLRSLLEGDVIRMRPDASVTSCGSLDEALRLLASRPCNLILLDLDLPDAKGLDGLRRIRNATSVSVAIVSASDSPRVKEQARELGARFFLEKGEDLDEFYVALRQALGAQ